MATSPYTKILSKALVFGIGVTRTLLEGRLRRHHLLLADLRRRPARNPRLRRRSRRLAELARRDRALLLQLLTALRSELKPFLQKEGKR